MLKIPAPRLLPASIAAMAALLLLKCGVLLNAAVTHGFTPDSVMVTVANAASTEQIREPAKPGAPVAQPKVTAPPSPPQTSPSQTSPVPAAPVGPPPVTESEKALLQELRQRRQDLEQRADAVATRESLLVAAEQKLTARVAELQALQARLEGLSGAQKQREEAGWQGLVKLYETMKPKDAATIFNDLSMPVLLQLMDRMKDAKAALVMAAMNTDKARDVTAQLARMRTGRDASGAPIAGPNGSPAGG
jgi:flagellar motility protein MotE (MotC chaperone)